jgi:hypothetical protein
MKIIRTCALLLAVCATLATHAFAADYNDLASFQAATTSLTHINFDLKPDGTAAPSSGPIGSTYASLGVVFPPGNNFEDGFIQPTSLPNGWINDTAVGSDRIFDANITIGGVTAAGIHNVLFATVSRLDAYNGNTLLESVLSDSDGNTLDFYGVTTLLPITRITITALTAISPGGWGLDDLYFGAVVPEPSSAVLFLIGTFGLAGPRLTRRRDGGR